MSSPSTYLVTGATGAQGGAVARALLKAGQHVHAFVRDPAKSEAKELEKLGAVLFIGEFDNVEAIKKATVGVKGVFINPYPVFGDPTGEGKQAQRFVDAAREAGTVESLVISTVLNTDKHARWVKEVPDYPMKQYYESKSSAEDAVRNSGIKYWTVLRPPWLFHNYLSPHNRFQFPQLHAERKLRTAIRRDLPLAHLDPADVGPWAAAALLDPAKFAGKEIDLGAENLTLEQVVRALEQFAGVEITTEFLEPAEFAKDTSNPIAPMIAGSARWMNETGAALTDEELEELKTYGLPLTPFTEFLEKNKAAVFADFKPGAENYPALPARVAASTSRIWEMINRKDTRRHRWQSFTPDAHQELVLRVPFPRRAPLRV